MGEDALTAELAVSKACDHGETSRPCESTGADASSGSVALSSATANATGNTAADVVPASKQLDAELKQLRDSTPNFVGCGQEVAKGTGFLKFAGDAGECSPSEVVIRLLDR